MNKISSITYNWHYTTESGESYGAFYVGKNDVTEIHEHPAAGEGDKWYYDIHFKDGSVDRIFNINSVKFHP